MCRIDADMCLLWGRGHNLMFALTQVRAALLGRHPRRFCPPHGSCSLNQCPGSWRKLYQRDVHAKTSLYEEIPEGSFTPFTLISYDTSPLRLCHHAAKILVDASPESCFEIWNTWPRLMDFLDLIAEVHSSEEMSENVAMLICHYRWGQTPTMEIMVKLEKYDLEHNKSIRFRSTDGMPMKGIVEFSRKNDLTEVSLRFEHCIPSVYVEYNIGNFVVSTHIDDILRENMDLFKQIVEGKVVPPPQHEMSESEKAEMAAEYREIIQRIVQEEEEARQKEAEEGKNDTLDDQGSVEA